MTVERADPYTRLGARPLPSESFTREETYRHTRASVDLAVTLIPDAYTSWEFFEIERKKVFSKNWVPVCCTSEVAESGQVVVAEVAGSSVIVTRSKDGELRAFHNVCRHRAAKLLDDDTRGVRKNRIRCPYHSWTYDLEGRCLGTPLFEGSDIPEEVRSAFDMSEVRDFEREDYGLLPVRVESWGFLVFVNLDGAAPPLEEILGDLPERLSGYRLDEWGVAREKRYDVAANYKLVCENFLEYYHLPWVHPELVEVSRMEDHYRWQGPGMYSGFCTTPISQNTEGGGWQGLPAPGFLNEDDAQSGRFLLLFPNIAISVLPNHAFVLFSEPVSPSRTVERAVILTHPESHSAPEAEGELDQLLRFWDLVNRQDIEIVERVQQGISNPAYRGGRMCYRFEETLHRYQNMVIDAMLDIRRIPEGDREEMVQMFPSGDDDSPG